MVLKEVTVRLCVTIVARPDSICHGFRSSGPDTDRDKVAFSLFKLLKYENLIRT